MDTRRISPALRRRVGLSPSNYDKATPTQTGQGADVVGRAASGNTPTLGENRDYYAGDRTGVIRSVPMGTDWQAIERAFTDKRALAQLGGAADDGQVGAG